MRWIEKNITMNFYQDFSHFERKTEKKTENISLILKYVKYTWARTQAREQESRAREQESQAL